MSGDEPQSSPATSLTFCNSVWSGQEGASYVLFGKVTLGVLQTVTNSVAYLFLLFLVITLRPSLRALRERVSPSRRFFFGFIWVLAVTNWFRTTVNLYSKNFGSQVRGVAWPNAEDIVIIALNIGPSTLLWWLELSILVFWLHYKEKNWRKLFTRIVGYTSFLAACYLAANILVVTFSIQNRAAIVSYYFNYHATMLIFNLAVHSVALLFYGILLMLIFLPCGKCIRMPRKRMFLFYLGFVLVLHCGSVIGRSLAAGTIEAGYCILALETLVRYGLFSPVFYMTFLYDYLYGKPKDTPNNFSDLLRNASSYYAANPDEQSSSALLYSQTRAHDSLK